MTSTVKLDDVCHDCHLKMLSEKIVSWELIAFALGLSSADNEVIRNNHLHDYKLQKYKMLCEWKIKNSSNATYRFLLDVLINNEQIDLADKLRDEIMKVPVPLGTVVLQRFKVHLKLRYKQGMFVYEQWPPPPPSDIFINLALIKEQNVKYNKIDNMFIKSTIHYCPDDVLKIKEPIDLIDIFKFEESERKCILIEAGPGLGKTTLSFKICKDWAAGDLLQDYDAVIMLQLRLPELHEAKNVVDLLITIEDDDEFKQTVLKEIRDTDGDRVCLILEGFDELPQELQKKSIFTKISELLPRAMIIYTSRPVAVSQVIQKLISKRIEIIGFKSEQVLQYVEATLVDLYKQELNTGKVKATELMEIIKSNTFVERIVHIPIYLAIITYLFYSDKHLPSTRTTLYQLLVKSIIIRHFIEKCGEVEIHLESLENLPEKEGKHFSNMCHLAFQGLENGEITFTTKHLRRYNIPKDINGLGLLHIAPMWSNCGKDQSLNFMHLNFQEFCAAFHISKLPEHEQQAIFTKHQDNPKFQICWQFFAGLTKLNCQQIFTSMIPKSNIYCSLCKHDLIQLLLCLYEAESPDLCKQTIKCMNGNIDLSGYDMDLLSCSALSYFINNCSCGSIKTLKLAWCGIGDKGLQCICESLIWNCKSILYGNSHLLSLDFSYSDLTECGAFNIANLLSSSCCIESLNCTGNCKLGDRGVEIIANSLLNNYVSNLELRKTGLGLKGVQAICKVLSSDSIHSKLKVLDISKNPLDFEMLSCLSKPLGCNSTLTTLQLKWCNLGANEARVLSNIKYCIPTNLDLGYNKLGGGGIANAIEAFKENQTLQTLNLNVSGLICDDAYYIADLISANLCHMSSLHVGGNFDEQGLGAVCEALKNNYHLTTLDLTPYSMSVSERSLSCLETVFNNTHIKSLHIVPPDDCSDLSVVIASNTTLEELKISVKVTHGFIALIEGIAKNKTITKLEFLFTKLERQWLKDISNMLQTKTNLTSLAINGEVYPEDWTYLYDPLLNCSLLQNLSFTPYQKMIPPTCFEFLERLQALDSLVSITFTLNSHRTQDDETSDQEPPNIFKPSQQTEGSGIHYQSESQSKAIPKVNLLILRQIECLISSINKKRHTIAKPELHLIFQEN